MSLHESKRYPLHHDETVHVRATPDEVFAFVDDHRQLAGHMTKGSWMMAGGKFETTTDAEHGQAVGSRIHMGGRVLGVPLALDEVVTERQAPAHKAWETIGAPALVVVGAYRMAFDIDPEPAGASIRVSIDYDLPEENAWLGKLFGKSYAKWCVRQMTGDVTKHFA